MAVVYTAQQGDKCCPCHQFGMHFVGCPCFCHAPAPVPGEGEVKPAMTARELRTAVSGMKRCLARLEKLAEANEELQVAYVLERDCADLTFIIRDLERLLDAETAAGAGR
jgi:hypothetical protein